MPEQQDGSDAAAKNAKATETIAQEIKSGERWLIGIQSVTLVVSCFIAVIYYQQLQEMVGVSGQTDALTRAYRRQERDIDALARETHNLAGEAQIQAIASNKIATNAALQSANTSSIANSTRGEVDAMKTQFQLDQRAWIGVQAIKVTGTYDAPQDAGEVLHTAETSPITGSFSPIEFTLVNSGKTPGIVAKFSGVMEMGHVRKNAGQEEFFIPNGTTLRMKVTVPPKVLIPGQTARGEFDAIQQAGTFAAFPSVRITALIAYEDIWGKLLHTTKVCFFANGQVSNSAYTYCPDPDNTED